MISLKVAQRPLLDITSDMFSQAAGHIEAGAKKVIISAPGKGDLKTLVSECT